MLRRLTESLSLIAIICAGTFSKTKLPTLLPVAIVIHMFGQATADFTILATQLSVAAVVLANWLRNVARRIDRIRVGYPSRWELVLSVIGIASFGVGVYLQLQTTPVAK